MTVPLGIGVLWELQPESLVERHGTSEIGDDQADDVQLRHLRMIAAPRRSLSQRERRSGAGELVCGISAAFGRRHRPGADSTPSLHRTGRSVAEGGRRAANASISTADSLHAYGGFMEPSGRNRWQMARRRKRLKQAKTVAVGCDQLPEGSNVRRGSTVRVRQRASAYLLLIVLFRCLCGRRARFLASSERPRTSTAPRVVYAGRS
jgi:hypothetical protein